tara:strand:- start:8520 stop:9071 length:552 start_codon:yes stop_codon:yes gene_type:complete
MQNDTQTRQKAAVETDTVEVSSKKGRNYSFTHRADSTLDAVETDDDQVYVIPAQPGSTYWAILRIVYEHADQPLTANQIIDEVAELLEDRDPDKWEKYKNKGSITTHKDGKQVQKPANDWRKRIETNIKTLTRSGGSNPYGKRLIERGHILRWEPNLLGGQGAFILRTTTNEPLPKKSKKAED